MTTSEATWRSWSALIHFGSIIIITSPPRYLSGAASFQAVGKVQGVGQPRLELRTPIHCERHQRVREVGRPYTGVLLRGSASRLRESSSDPKRLEGPHGVVRDHRMAHYGGRLRVRSTGAQLVAAKGVCGSPQNEWPGVYLLKRLREASASPACSACLASSSSVSAWRSRSLRTCWRLVSHACARAGQLVPYGAARSPTGPLLGSSLIHR